MKKEYAEYLINKTREDYNLIAGDFSRTRQNPWPELEFLFNNYLKDGDNALDLGCGNGRYFEFFKGKNAKYTGVDNSEKLIEIAQKKYGKDKFIVANALKLPFKDSYFDKIYSIAILHHFPSKETRKQFLKEAKRVLKPNGLLILTVWKFHQIKQIALLFKYTFLKIFGFSKMDFKDIIEPWADKIKRYYRWFSKRELKKLVEEVGFEVKECGIAKNQRGNRRNIYLVAAKQSSL